MLTPDVLLGILRPLWKNCRNCPTADDLVETWLPILGDCHKQDLARAVVEHLRTCEEPWMPMPATLLKAAKRHMAARLGGTPVTAEKAVANAKRVAGSVYHADIKETISVAYSKLDPITAAIVNENGGFEALSNCNSDEWKWLKKTLVEAYDQMLTTSTPKQIKTLTSSRQSLTTRNPNSIVGEVAKRLDADSQPSEE